MEIINNNLLKFKKIYEFESNLRKIILNNKIQKQILENNFKMFKTKFTSKKFDKKIIEYLT